MKNLWATGYTQGELDTAQERFGLCFPPDLVELLLDRRPIWGWDWRTDEVGIRAVLGTPLSGLLFDVEHNVLWWPEWGERPRSAEERAEVVSSVVQAAPPLIPIIAHRFIPQLPNEVGNPVFSVMQSDVIYYGTNLEDYLEREFHPEIIRKPMMLNTFKFIPFWSDLVERNGPEWANVPL
ncbi:MAG: SMI1/KNR4 family protein [Brevundimonas sp.]|uniref:SMI1/KNR4 family protein n=1 Tax=Brevundimonas sp. TaxID=1871086 RepID=UPI001A22328B|nr:SMI1/KNR4 family protein [Brevundimonas sp.]MBJ7447938.1 SMI1/KNR4 family protein [Brevundimonas sp.]